MINNSNDLRFPYFVNFQYGIWKICQNYPYPSESEIANSETEGLTRPANFNRPIDIKRFHELHRILDSRELLKQYLNEISSFISQTPDLQQPYLIENLVTEITKPEQNISNDKDYFDTSRIWIAEYKRFIYSLSNASSLRIKEFPYLYGKTDQEGKKLKWNGPKAVLYDLVAQCFDKSYLGATQQLAAEFIHANFDFNKKDSIKTIADQISDYRGGKKRPKEHTQINLKDIED